MTATLVVSLLIFTLALAVSGAGLFHLNLSSREATVHMAQDLAESAIARVVERVLEQESRTGELDFGETQSTTEIIQPQGLPSGSFGLATFDPNFTDSLGTRVDPSLNNLRSDSATAATNGLVVPSESLYVVGYGVCAGVERRVEAIVYLPRFPYSVATQGPFEGRDLLIAGLDDDTTITPGNPIPPEALRAGHLVSNSTLDPGAIQIDGDTWVKGNVRSASSANLGPQTRVDGELLLYSAPAEIPTIDLTRYRPTGDQVFNGLLALERDLTLDRTAYFQTTGTPMIILGGLHFEGGFLYVDGDVEIQGGLHGKGAIIATGNITLTDAASLSSDNVAALMAGGDINIQGSTSSPEDSIIEGLVYAGGQVNLRDVTLVGTLVSAGNGQSQMNNTIILEREQHGTFEITGIDTSTRNDPTTWEHIEFELTQAPSPDAILTYQVISTSPIDYNTITQDLARDLSSLESRVATETDAALSALTTEREENDTNPLSGGIQPWRGTLVVAPVSETQIRTVVTRGTSHTQVTDVVTSRTVLSIDLSEFISPLERMRVKWWRNQ